MPACRSQHTPPGASIGRKLRATRRLQAFGPRSNARWPDSSALHVVPPRAQQPYGDAIVGAANVHKLGSSAPLPIQAQRSLPSNLPCSHVETTASLQSSVLIGAYSVAPLIAAFAIILYLSFCSDSEHRDLVEEYGCEPAHSSSLKHPWLFGIDFLLENARNVLQHRFAAGVHERFLRYGSTHASRIFHKHIINTIDPLNLECIMKTHADDYTIVPFRKKLVAGILGKGGSATEGQEWLESRCMIKIGLDCCAFDEQLLGPHAAALVAEIRCLGPTAFDPAQLAMRYAMDVTSQVLFGTSTATLSSMRGQINENQFAPQWTALCRLMRSMTIFFSQRQRLGKLTWSRQLREVQGRVIAFVDCEVQRARCLITHKNFPKSIVAVKDAATSIADGVVACTPDDTRTRGELLNILLAGHESVGLALSETLNLLAARPGVYARLRAVVLHHLGDREPSIADLNTIPYLEWTIAEGMHYTSSGVGSLSDIPPQPIDSIPPSPFMAVSLSTQQSCPMVEDRTAFHHFSSSLGPTYSTVTTVSTATHLSTART